MTDNQEISHDGDASGVVEFAVLRSMRDEVGAPTPASRAVARTRFDDVAPLVEIPPQHPRTKTFATRAGIAGVLVAALVATVVVVSQRRLDHAVPSRRVVVPVSGNKSSGQPQVYLLVGTDSRSLTQTYAERGGARADTISLLYVQPKLHALALLSLPRDLWVTPPGHVPMKINEVFDVGGPQLLVTTIQRDLHIPIDHYLQLDFAGFTRIVNLVGGVHIRFSHAVRDAYTGLRQDRGCGVLDGASALGLARSRHLQFYDDVSSGRAKWVSDGRGDLGRIEREQIVLQAIAFEAIVTAGPDPVPLFRQLLDQVTVDAGASSRDIVNLFVQVRRPRSVRVATLATLSAVRDEQKVLMVSEEGRRQLANFLVSPVLDERSPRNVGLVHASLVTNC